MPGDPQVGQTIAVRLALHSLTSKLQLLKAADELSMFSEHILPQADQVFLSLQVKQFEGNLTTLPRRGRNGCTGGGWPRRCSSRSLGKR